MTECARRRCHRDICPGDGATDKAINAMTKAKGSEEPVASERMNECKQMKGYPRGREGARGREGGGARVVLFNLMKIKGVRYGVYNTALVAKSQRGRVQDE
jgi:hypothetical protein